MLSFKNRFHGYGSLKYVFKNGHTTRGHHLVLRYLENPRRHHSRIAVVVSKKVHKRAVRRNRIRRRVYEIIRHNLTSLDGVYDLVFIITSPEADSLNHEDLNSQINSLIDAAGLYKNPK